jgi:4-amino-4-deoxy-L-arabinose transferase-like glycosyltransferase
MMLPKHEMARLALIIAVALAARLVFVVWWPRTQTFDSRQFEFPDSQGYWELGRHMARGEPYEFGSSDRRVYRAPGYPLLLASMFRVLGSDAKPVAARVLGALMGTLCVGVVYWLARIMFSVDVAFVAAAIVAVYPEAIATSVLPLSDGPFCLWMLLQLAFWQRVCKSASQRAWGWATLAGLMAGIATLTRPSWLLFTPVAAAVWIVATRFERRQLWSGLTILIAFTLTMTPWWIRNWHVAGRFVPTTLQMGASLYDGLSPTADGSSDMRFVPHFEEQLRATDLAHPPAESDPPFEYRLDRLMRNESLDWAFAHPGRVAELAATKLLRLWNVWPNEPSFRGWTIRLAIFSTYTPILLLAIVGFWQNRRNCFDVMFLAAPAAYFSALHIIFIGSLRYRQPAMLTLAILAAAGICSLLSRPAATRIESQPIVGH